MFVYYTISYSALWIDFLVSPNILLGKTLSTWFLIILSHLKWLNPTHSLHCVYVYTGVHFLQKPQDLPVVS